jgi:putative hemolysin
MPPVLGIIAVFVLVAANGFFVAAEFALVAVRRSRVAELANAGQRNARALQQALDRLDAHLAATQLGITIASLALGWIGEPALAHLIEPLLALIPDGLAIAGSHAIAIAFSFVLITALHIVLGELAPKSLALQRSERTALAVVRPLGLFLFLLRPAIAALNGLGNLVLRLAGLQPGSSEETLHSPDELKLLVAASQEAGLLDAVQQELAERVLAMRERRIAEIMTPRVEIDWIDADDPPDKIRRDLQASRHEQMLVARGDINRLVGMVLKKDLLDQALGGAAIDPLAVVRQPLLLQAFTPMIKVVEQFRRAPVRLAVVIDEYGNVEGLVTHTDLLEAIAGELAENAGADPAFLRQEDGALVLDGLMSAHEAFRHLGWPEPAPEAGFHTIAGFVLARLTHLPEQGEAFVEHGWRFEIVDLQGRRINRLRATPQPKRL